MKIIYINTEDEMEVMDILKSHEDVMDAEWEDNSGYRGIRVDAFEVNEVVFDISKFELDPQLEKTCEITAIIFI